MRGLIVASLLLAMGSHGHAQVVTVGLQHKQPGSYVGYDLFAPMGSTTTYLTDHDGLFVHSWPAATTPGMAVYLLDNGDLLRPATTTRDPRFNAGGAAGRVETIAWDGTLLWRFDYTASTYLSHHDVEWLPNGNVLVIAWEVKSQAEAIAAGRDPALVTANGLWPDHVIEVEPILPSGGNIVWEWHLWDHLIQDFDATKANYGVVANSPELVDINAREGGMAGAADWVHTNGIAYHPGFDQILLSIHSLSEIWVIDHSTTTAEAAGHSGGRYGKGGDLLYRWGNPRMYRAGTAADRQLFSQHDARWIEPGLPGEGNITVFNNGGGRPGGNHSSIEEIVPPVDASGNYSLGTGPAYPPAAPVWTYKATPTSSFYATNISGAHRLPNGNTMICNGPAGTFFEVNAAGVELWRYVSPVTRTSILQQGQAVPVGMNNNQVFRVHRYAPDHPGLQGRDLTPGTQVEVYPCRPTPAILYMVKAAPDLRLEWSPACTTRWLRSSLAASRVGIEVPFASANTTSAVVATPAENLVFYSID